jgi:hypothetical protein
MGSPISSTLAEIYLQYLEETHTKHYLEHKRIIYYKRYVDHIFIIFDQTKTNSDTIINLINKVDEHLEFKASEEENNTIHYLDLPVSRNTDSLVLNIYRKPTYIDITVNFISHHPHNQKLAAFILHINRMINMPIKNAMVKQEW